MRKILAVICVLFLANCLWLFMRSGIGNTFLLNLGLFLGTGIYAVFFERLKKIKWLNFAIVIFMLVYSALAGFIMIYGRIDTAAFDEDVVIVLGAGLRGEEITPTLRNRLDRAVEYHHKNPEAIIIVSGGQGRGDVITEASAMARYLEENGVPKDLIIQEGGSHSTYQNMRLSKEILTDIFPEMSGSLRVVVITNDFHIYRAVRFTRIVGMYEATSFHGDTPLISLPGALVREVAAVIKMWLIGT